MTNSEYVLPVSLVDMLNICGGISIVGNERLKVLGFCSVNDAIPNYITFIDSEKLIDKISYSYDSIYIVRPECAHLIKQGIIHDNPKQAFRLILNEFYKDKHISNISDSANISDTAIIGENVIVGDYSVIEDSVIIGDNCIIGNHSTICAGSSIGDNSNIGNRVTLYNNCIIGNRCVISDGSTIGGAGFGFNLEAGSWKHMPQIGRVIIRDEVYIGNNSCIDRGSIKDTIIGNNVIIDNLVHIAHNVEIGCHSAMASGVGIAGSTKIGKHCLFGGQVGVVGHISICDNVKINGGAKVLKSINIPGNYSGSINVMPSNKWNKASIYFKKLEKIFIKGKKSE